MDLRHAWRSILKMPVLSTVVVVSLGIGIGVNTAVFSWVQAVVLRPLPGVPDASRFHLVEPRAETGSYPGVSWLEYGDLRNRLRSFPELLGFRMAPFTLGDPGRSERIFGLLVSGNYFSVLGMRPALGRFVRPDEATRPGAEPVVVISHDFWQTRFGGASDVVGRTLRVNDRQLTIIGVTPERFQGTVLGLNFDLWVPATLAPALQGGSLELEDRTMRGYNVMGRLPSHIPLARAQAELDQAMRELGRAYPETNATLQAAVRPFWNAPRGPQRMLATALAVLQGIMLILLLAVCGNTANLVLARASTRQREMGVRLALGAGPWRVISLILAENILLGLMGAALGAAIAVWATDALRAVPLIGAFPIKFQTDLDLVSLAFAMVLGAGCGLIFGVAPALQLSRVEPQTALRSGTRTAGRSGLRNALMGVEVGLALVVLLAAALFWRSFSETRDADPGFKREGVLLAAYDFTERNAGAPVARDFAARLLERLRALPGVDAAAIASAVPLDIHGLPLRSFTLEGRAPSAAAPDQALSNTVTPGYLQTMGIPLVAGTDFADLRDTATPPQAIVNEEFVRRFLDGREPLGRRLENRGTNYAIAGVARNSTSESFGEAPIPIIYFSYRDRPAARGEIHLRTRAGTESLLAPEVERVVRELDPSLPVYDVRTLTEHVDKNLFLRRIPARMFVVLGPLLLVLAAIGIYAVVAYAVAQRTTEIGVRLALGATAGRIVSQIIGESLRVIGAGALVAWMIALFVAVHLVRGPIEPAVFVGVPLLLLLVAAFACWLPARRATSVDVMVALRQE
jgi:putative ABC transport system permease protein